MPCTSASFRAHTLCKSLKYQCAILDSLDCNLQYIGKWLELVLDYSMYANPIQDKPEIIIFYS